MTTEENRNETPNSLEKQDPNKLVKQKRLFSFLGSSKVPPIPTDEERSYFKEYHTNYISRIMFWWLNPILKTGYKRTLQAEDLYKLDEHQKVDFMYKKFMAFMEKDLEKRRKMHITKKCKLRHEPVEKSSVSAEEDLEDFKMPLITIPLCLYKTLWFEYTVGIVLKIFSDTASATAPLLQKKLTEFVELRTLNLEPHVGKGVGYAVGCCLMIFFVAVTINLSFYHLMSCGAKSKAIMTKVLLNKAMHINSKGNHIFSAGKVNSMMSTDLNRIDLAIGYFPFMLTCIFPITIAIALLIVNIGVSALVGIGIFFVVVGLIGMTIKKLLVLRRKATKFTDIRVNLTKELLKNFKMIKFYSWEPSYSKRMEDARVNEMKYIFSLQGVRNALISLAMALPNISSMASFCTAYRVSSGRSIQDIFASLSLFQVLSQQFILVPLALSMTTDMMVGLKRISEFLSCDDVDATEFSYTKFTDEKLAIKIHDASFEWETFEDEETEEKTEHQDELDRKDKEEQEDEDNISQLTNDININADNDFEDTSDNITDTKTSTSLNNTDFPGLNNINLEISKGEFIVITGTIGSGKSSLLNAISGFMKRIRGDVLVDGELLLCGYPWVQNATVRENILFGLPFDGKKYKDVIYACSLQNDFNQYPGGDMTEVGERGITLSGGQKARINLARAVYADKDIILLDDVLSAVDAKVGKHIIDKCLLGLLKDKTRVLATHQLSLIDNADKMIFLNGDGSIDVGTIEELKSRNQNVINLFKFNKDDEKKTDEEIELSEEEIKLDQNELKLKLKLTMTKDYADNKNNNNTETVRIIGDEEKAVNGLTWDVYKHYMKLGFGYFNYSFPPIFLMVTVLSTFCNFFSNTWLSFWTSNKFPNQSSGVYIGLYIMFTFLFVIFLVAELSMLVFFSNNAARYLNILASKKLLHVPMAFMDVSPMGRVLNRFTKDTDVLDNEIVEQLRLFINPLSTIVGTIILCIIYIPWFAIVIPFMVFFYVGIANYYQASAREIKRIDAVKRSFVYSHFNETLGGKDTIKSYNLTDSFLNKINILIDNQNEAYYLTIANQRWLGTNLSLIAAGIVFIVSMLCCFRIFKTSASSTGLLLTYVMNMTNLLSLMMRALTQVENEFNSVERLNHYAYELVQEAAYESPELDPSPSWPENGSIIFNDVRMKYRPELPYVLKNVSMDIKPHEKVGFCGRTGAGKSTFMTCLYRLTEFEGLIKIDDVDISKLGLHTLRKKLTIIPQDPVLFVGTIRENLDPFNENSDDQLWNALKTSGLIEEKDLKSVKDQNKDDENLHKFHLERVVEDDGINFSLGERQLIALARALVRKTKILILDEATSSVDYETDSKIQLTIANEFSDCTILCIAHRLKTILNYDKIVVMDKGEIVEFDKPLTLFKNRGSIFRSMCDQSGLTEKDF